MTNNEIVSRETHPEPQQPGSHIGQMMQVIERAAMSPEVDVEKMSKLLDMQERIFDKQAEIEFNRAMVRAQNKMRPVIKDAQNDQTHSMYARLETIDRQIRPIYTAEGFALSFGTEDSSIESCVRVVCACTHQEGHVKHYRADIPLDMFGAKGNANKTATHGYGSSITYGQRYLTKLIFNIALAGEDDDGNKASPALARKVTPFQSGIISQRLGGCPDEVKEWFASAHGSPENVARKDFDELIAYLNQFIKANVDVSRETQGGNCDSQ